MRPNLSASVLGSHTWWRLFWGQVLGWWRNALADAVFGSQAQFAGKRIRKPLLYPSELRGHGRATVLDCCELRKADFPYFSSRSASGALTSFARTVPESRPQHAQRRLREW